MKYSNSVNSVHYFALLPYGLNDPAVVKTYVGEESLGQKTYHKLEITFMQDGGGKDHDDVFIYWFDVDTYRLDYLAYKYYTDGGGMRFREAFNQRVINGIHLADYENYKPEQPTELEKMGQAFESGTLKLLSTIALENVSVELLTQ